MIAEGTQLIKDAKKDNLCKSGQILANPETSRKTYWSLINSVLNKVKILIVPPLVENRLFIKDFAEKAQIFYDHFILQCSTIKNGSEILQDAPEVSSMICDFEISEEKILHVMRSVNPNKAHGWGEISIRMIKLKSLVSR